MYHAVKYTVGILKRLFRSLDCSGGVMLFQECISYCSSLLDPPRPKQTGIALFTDLISFFFFFFGPFFAAFAKRIDSWRVDRK